VTARDQLQNQAKRLERIAAYLYDRAASLDAPKVVATFEEMAPAALTASTLSWKPDSTT